MGGGTKEAVQCSLQNASHGKQTQNAGRLGHSTRRARAWCSAVSIPAPPADGPRPGRSKAPEGISCNKEVQVVSGAGRRSFSSPLSSHLGAPGSLSALFLGSTTKAASFQGQGDSHGRDDTFDTSPSHTSLGGLSVNSLEAATWGPNAPVRDRCVTERSRLQCPVTVVDENCGNHSKHIPRAEKRNASTLPVHTSCAVTQDFTMEAGDPIARSPTQRRTLERLATVIVPPHNGDGGNGCQDMLEGRDA
ncbi:hypothetical protein HPB50_011721 [Hyalomma asiaticum]|uniref:Uncharacterized protein n=1 Tax=Hyalomma asiaticum TaxID=266040 RepID=A0ACB7TJ04_HYAAI|nr:hypothetical protein HPB50_011721 [Hyalomma asiaticum]